MSSQPGTSSADTTDREQQWIWPRSKQILNGLSVPAQWEVTRRHPYYQILWRPARAENPDEFSPNDTSFARLLLNAIGVSGEYAPPGTPFSELVPDGINSAWHQDAISQVSVRSLVLMLIRSLDEKAKRNLADVFQLAAAINPQDTPAFHPFVKMLCKDSHPGFDLILPGSVFAVNTQASDQAISDTLTNVMKELRKEQGIPNTRRREDRLEDYLAVWDLREGWNGEQYDFTQQKPLKGIARDFKISTSTAENRYCSAFRRIIGYDYHIDCYIRTMGLLRTKEWTKARFGRPLNPRRRRPVPMTTLSSGRSSDSCEEVRTSMETPLFMLDDIAWTETCLDVRTLLEMGRSLEEMQEELELDEDATRAVIDYVATLHPPLKLPTNRSKKRPR